MTLGFVMSQAGSGKEFGRVALPNSPPPATSTTRPATKSRQA
jgi:hypothetical protein